MPDCAAAWETGLLYTALLTALFEVRVARFSTCLHCSVFSLQLLSVWALGRTKQSRARSDARVGLFVGPWDKAFFSGRHMTVSGSFPQKFAEQNSCSFFSLQETLCAKLVVTWTARSISKLRLIWNLTTPCTTPTSVSRMNRFPVLQ